MRSGQFLAGAEQDTPLAVGSLMKLLTAQTAYAAGDPVKVAIAPAGLIVDPEESRIGIGEGQELSRDLLVRAMLIVSANDAARMLAIDIAGGEAAVRRADEPAGRPPSGWPTPTPSTSPDSTRTASTPRRPTCRRLGAFLMGNQTFQLTVKRTSASLNGKTIPSTNDLLEKYPGADGIKTGHTTNAGWCITASALRDGRRIIVTVLGAPTEDGPRRRRDGAARLGVPAAVASSAVTEPIAERPAMTEYGVDTDAWQALPWSWAAERLAAVAEPLGRVGVGVRSAARPARVGGVVGRRARVRVLLCARRPQGGQHRRQPAGVRDAGGHRRVRVGRGPGDAAARPGADRPVDRALPRPSTTARASPPTSCARTRSSRSSRSGRSGSSSGRTSSATAPPAGAGASSRRPRPRAG